MASLTNWFISKAATLPKVERLLTWTLPALMIPTLGFLTNKQDQLHNFVRDFTRYTFGAALFLAPGLLLDIPVVHKALPKALRSVFEAEPRVKAFAQFTVGIVANLAYVGIGAEKLAQWVDTQWKKTQPDRPQNINPPPRSHSALQDATVLSSPVLLPQVPQTLPVSRLNIVSSSPSFSQQPVKNRPTSLSNSAFINPYQSPSLFRLSDSSSYTQPIRY